MGSGESTARYEDTAQIVADSTLTMLQDCYGVVSQSQAIVASGKGAVATGNIQRATLTFDADCVSRATQSSDLSAKLAREVTQRAADRRWPLVSRLDPATTLSSRIATVVANKLDAADIQRCSASLSGSQLIAASGDASAVRDNYQEQTGAAVLRCLTSSGQVADTVAEVTDAVNQSIEHDPASLFPWGGASKALLAVAAVLFIVVVALVFIVAAAKRRAAPAVGVVSAAPSQGSEMRETINIMLGTGPAGLSEMREAAKAHVETAGA